MLLVGPLRSTLQSSSCGGGRCRPVRRHLPLGIFRANYNVNWVIFVVPDFWIQSSWRFSTRELLHSCLLAFLMLTYIDLEQLLALLISTIIYLHEWNAARYSSVGYCCGVGLIKMGAVVVEVLQMSLLGQVWSCFHFCVVYARYVCQIPKTRTSANFAVLSKR